MVHEDEPVSEQADSSIPEFSDPLPPQYIFDKG